MAMSTLSNEFRLRTLCYHAVPESQREAFDAQMRCLRGRDVPIRPFPDCFAHSPNAAPKTAWSVSFDDGDRTLSDVAQPILDAHGIRAIVFVTTDYIERGRTYCSAKPLEAMTWTQLEHWLDAGHLIGGHTHNHRDLSRCTDAECLDELCTNRDLLIRRLGITPRHFAYPWGRSSPSAVAVIANSGQWDSASTVNPGWNTSQENPFLLRRDAVEPWWSPTRLWCSLGVRSHPWLHRLARHGRDAFRGRVSHCSH